MNSVKTSFKMKFSEIQPSQLYISKEKLAKVKDKFNSKDLSTLEASPIKKNNLHKKLTIERVKRKNSKNF